MNIIHNASIISKEYFNDKEFNEINELLDICTAHDKTCLKLELYYKKSSPNKIELNRVNEFLYYVDEKLIGYIGICNFGGSSIEVNGMVHPEYRRQGIFTELLRLVKLECIRLGNVKMLLLSDEKSESGLGFLSSIDAKYDFAEYEMYLKEKPLIPNKSNVTLRKATNEDSVEIANQNKIFFSDIHESDGSEEKEENIILPEDEEKRGFYIYMAEVENVIVGKVHLEKINGRGGIYGFGVVPNQRSKGYGREILLKSIEKLYEMGSGEIMLQVVIENKKALDLYYDCGFRETSTMNYYIL